MHSGPCLGLKDEPGAGPMVELKAMYPGWVDGIEIEEFASDAVDVAGFTGNTGPNIIFKKRTRISLGTAEEM